MRYSSEPAGPASEPPVPPANSFADRAKTTDPPADAVMEFPCSGTGPRTWHLTAAKVAEWSASFPGVDVLAECRTARQWVIDNKPKRKTHRGMSGFLGRWLARTQDRGGVRTAAAPATRPPPERALPTVFELKARGDL